MLAGKTWLLYYDKSLSHNVVIARQLVVKKTNRLLPTPCCSDIAPCDFWLFRRLKIVIEGSRFSSSEEIKASVTKEIKSLKEEEFAKCFRGWQDQMQSALTQKESTLRRTICNLSANVELKVL